MFFLPIWKSAIDFINPHIIVVPNLYQTSCEPIVNYAKKKNIDIFMHSSEGMFYTDEIQKTKLSAAEAEIVTLKNKVTSLETTVADLISRITALESQ